MTKYNQTHKLKFVLAATILLIVCIFLCLFLFVNDVHSPTKASSASSKTLTQKIWNTMSGASENQDGSVDFTPLERKIVNQDGSGGQTNPPVNVGGPTLQFDDTFQLDIGMNVPSNTSATFRFYKDVPNIYDEWRYEGVSASVTIIKNVLRIESWNGLQEAPYFTKDITIQAQDTHTLTLKKSGTVLAIYLDSQLKYEFNYPDLFTAHKLWFGAEAKDGNWILTSFVVKEGRLVSTVVGKTGQLQESLASLATKKRQSLKMGSAISLYPLMTDQAYQNIALNQFSIWTPENEMKAQFIHPLSGTYVFSDADLLVNTALKNDISVHGHALVFGEANPSWMQTAPKESLKNIMTDHIETIMKHYAGRVSEWDVINEPLSDNDTDYATDGLRRSIWYKAMGESFISEALLSARKADPQAKLYINEYGLEEDGDRWDVMLGLIKKLQAANIPLDGIGFQSHVYEDGDQVNSAVLRSHIQTLQKLGLKSRISEIDVHGEDANSQAEQYQAVLAACLAEESCTSFSTWGITDAYGSTTSDHTYPLEFGNDLLWDSSMKPKKVYDSLVYLLKR